MWPYKKEEQELSNSFKKKKIKRVVLKKEIQNS
jgi:hypothetical protein